MSKLKVMTIFGTRPEAVKMAPLVLELNKHADQIESIVCVTAQHRQILDQVLEFFEIQPDYDLNVMKDRQTLTETTVRVLEGLDPVLTEAKPDIVLVHGDTQTTFFGQLRFFSEANSGRSCRSRTADVEQAIAISGGDEPPARRRAV